MDDLQKIDDGWGSPPETHRTEKPKERRCLICAKPFLSEWSGERVCKCCKSSSTWRSGLE